MSIDTAGAANDLTITVDLDAVTMNHYETLGIMGVDFDYDLSNDGSN